MSFTYDLSTDAGKVRLLIPDNHSTSYILEDDEIDAFLALEGNVKRATAMALETIASNETLVLKAIKLLDLSTDGPKVAESLMKRAKLLREQAEQDGLIDGSGFDIAEMAVDVFSTRSILSRDYLYS